MGLALLNHYQGYEKFVLRGDSSDRWLLTLASMTVRWHLVDLVPDYEDNLDQDDVIMASTSL